MRRFAILLALMLVPTACGGGIDSGDSSIPSTTTSSETSTTLAPARGETTTTTMNAEHPSSTTTLEVTTTTMADPNSVADEAIGMLAADLKVPAGQITIVKAERLTWADGSLGCPKADTVYTQALVDGTQVVLQYQDRMYDYHAGFDGIPFLCRSEEKDGGYEFVPPPGFDE